HEASPRRPRASWTSMSAALWTVSSVGWPVGVAATASWSGWRRLRVNAGRQVTVGQCLPRRGLPPLDRSATLLQTVIQKGASGEEDVMLMWVLIAVLVTATTVV